MKNFGFLNLPTWQEEFRELLVKRAKEDVLRVPVLGSEDLERPWKSLEEDDFFSTIDFGIAFFNQQEVKKWNKPLVTSDLDVAIDRIKQGLYAETFFRAATGGSFSVLSLANSFLWHQPDTLIIQNDAVASFVLSKMEKENKNLEESIREAQWKDVASENPNKNLHGIITRNRFSLQIAEIFGEFIAPENIDTFGINTLSLKDIFITKKMGYSIRLLGIAKKNVDNLCVCVEPCIIPEKYFLAQAKGGSEILYIKESNGESHVYACPGESKESTVKALLADIYEPTKKHKNFKILNHNSSLPGNFYFRVSINKSNLSILQLTTAFLKYDVKIKKLEYSEEVDKKGFQQIILLTDITERKIVDKISEMILKDIPSASVESIFRFIQ